MEKENQNNIIVFCSDGTNSRLLIDFLSKNFNVSAVYIEPSEPKSKVFRRRMKNLGLFRALGQVAFQLGILPFISHQKRTSQILSDSKLTATPIKKDLIRNISSINDIDMAKALSKHKPQLIFINGTSIIAQAQLDKIKVPLINIHVGITPAYRGVHGGYWAIRDNKPELFGVTLHLVDKGIDTGGIIDQLILKVDSKDNFKTFPLIQYLGGIDLIEKNLEQIRTGEIKTKPSITSESKLHSHPSFFQYLFGNKRFKPQ